MRQLEERILIRELGKLAGFFGGFGARLAARRLPVEEHAITVDVNSQVEDIRSAVMHILQGIGKVTDEFASHNPDGGRSAIVGSGQMNLNQLTRLHGLGHPRLTTALSGAASARP